MRPDPVFSIYKSLIRPWLFRFDAEAMHHGTVEACRWLGAVPGAAMMSRSWLESRDESSVTLLHRYASYLSLNLSCPNAAGGQDFFAQPGNITRLLERLQPLGIRCPVFLKIAPRDDPAEHERVLMECEAFACVRGFCFNLPAGKPDTLRFTTPREAFAHLPGAVAGLINRCLSGFYARMDRQRYILIGAGGVFSAQDAYRKIRAGASLLQLYTAMIYEGPRVTGRICLGLAELLKRDGFANVKEAVGTS